MSIDIEEFRERKGNAFGTTNKVNYRRYSNALKKALEQLQAENKRLKKDNEWISVEDRLPDDNTMVVSCYVGVYELDLVLFWRDTKTLHFGHQPATHWMPIPKPPED